MTMLTRNTDELRAVVKAHLDADALIRGRYWGGGKGCFIGCLNHSSDPSGAFDRFRLTVEIQRIAESIHESLPDEDGRAFFAALPDAVDCDGKDLSRVHWAFLAEELRALPEVPQDVQAVIDPVIEGMDRLAIGQEWSARAARAAAHAAASVINPATHATAYAARTANRAATAAIPLIAPRASAFWDVDHPARAAGCAVDAATYAIYAAARAADAPSDAAAYAAARARRRDTLLRLIAEAPMGDLT